jgi:hypothetical protein
MEGYINISGGNVRSRIVRELKQRNRVHDAQLFRSMAERLASLFAASSAAELCARAI